MLVCLGVWLLTVPGCADVIVQLTGVEGRVPVESPLPAVFGGREQVLQLKVTGAPAPRKGVLVADLFQVAGRLAMPVARNLPLKEVPAPATASYTESISLKFPEVKNRTRLLIRLSLADPSIPDHQESWGECNVEVFPTTLTQEVRDAAISRPDGQRRFVVFGTGKKLRQQLTSMRVAFEDAGSGPPDRWDAALLYLGDTVTQEEARLALDRSTAARLVLFTRDDALPPGIYAGLSPTGTLVQVSLPVLDNLDNDPRQQLAFLKILRQFYPPNP